VKSISQIKYQQFATA